MEAMVKRIQLESRGKNPEDVKHLNLDCCRSTQIYGLTEEFKNLESLSMIDTGLTTLKGFPALPNLKKLELSDNRLLSGLEALQGCTKLSQLSLGGNRLKDIACLEPLKALPNLKNLDLFNCEVTAVEEYRKKVYQLLPNLDVLDNFDKRARSIVGNNEDDYGSQSDDDDDEDSDDGEDGGEEADSYNYKLNYLEKSGLENESEGEEFNPGNDISEEEIEDEDDEEDEAPPPGTADDDVDGDDDDDVEDDEVKESAAVTQDSRKRKRPEGEDEEN